MDTLVRAGRLPLAFQAQRAAFQSLSLPRYTQKYCKYHISLLGGFLSFSGNRAPHLSSQRTTRNINTVHTTLAMSAVTNPQSDAPDVLVHRPIRGFHASTSRSSESLASVDTIQEGREKYPPLERSKRSQPMSSVHFLLAHQPSRLEKPGHITERKREHDHEHTFQVQYAF